MAWFEQSLLVFHSIKQQLFRYIFKKTTAKQNKTKQSKNEKKKEGEWNV